MVSQSESQGSITPEKEKHTHFRFSYISNSANQETTMQSTNFNTVPAGFKFKLTWALDVVEAFREAMHFEENKTVTSLEVLYDIT